MPETNESTKTKQRKYDLIELYKFLVEYEEWYNNQQASTTDSGSNPGGTPPPPPGSNP